MCDALEFRRFDLPETLAERRATAASIGQQLSDMNRVISETDGLASGILTKIAPVLVAYDSFVSDQIAIFHTLNCFDRQVSDRAMVAEAWAPRADVELVQSALAVAAVGLRAAAVGLTVSSHRRGRRRCRRATRSRRPRSRRRTSGRASTRRGSRP